MDIWSEVFLWLWLQRQRIQKKIYVNKTTSDYKASAQQRSHQQNKKATNQIGGDTCKYIQWKANITHMSYMTYINTCIYHICVYIYHTNVYICIISDNSTTKKQIIQLENGQRHYGKQYGGPSKKLKNGTDVWPSNSTYRYISKETQNTN